MEKLLLTIEESKKLLGCSRPKLIQLLDAGRIRWIDLNEGTDGLYMCRRIPRAEIDRYLENNMRGPKG